MFSPPLHSRRNSCRPMNPVLTIVPTPIGNLEDITLRALRVLRSSDVILAEDTRTSARLMQEYDIKAPLVSYHKFNEHQMAADIAEQIGLGRQVCLISDAGTPGISDPGFLLVRTCVERGIEVECLPGATAVIPALVASGLPCDRFFFEGFLPHKKGRQTRMEQLIERDVTTVFYESPNRLLKTLQLIRETIGDGRQVVVAREISKKFEEYKRGTASQLEAYFTDNPPLGEIVVMVAGVEKEEKEHKNKYKNNDGGGDE